MHIIIGLALLVVLLAIPATRKVIGLTAVIGIAGIVGLAGLAILTGPW
jgi:hypothetical protein